MSADLEGAGGTSSPRKQGGKWSKARGHPHHPDPSRSSSACPPFSTQDFAYPPLCAQELPRPPFSRWCSSKDHPSHRVVCPRAVGRSSFGRDMAWLA